MTSVEYLYSSYSGHGYISQETYLLAIELEREATKKIIERYNDYLNFEYAQFGLDEQDINEFLKIIEQ